MTKKAFDISFTLDNQFYNGWVDPEERLDTQGLPKVFHVVLNDSLFGAVSFNDCSWSVNEERPLSLLKKVGEQIEKHYKF